MYIMEAGMLEWRDYIALDFKDPQFGAVVAAVLDQETRTPEMQDLLQRSRKNLAASRAYIDALDPRQRDSWAAMGIRIREDGKISLTDGALMSKMLGNIAFPGFGVISLSEADISQTVFARKDGQWQVAGLTHFIVHEVFHQATIRLDQEVAAQKEAQAGELTVVAQARIHAPGLSDEMVMKLDLATQQMLTIVELSKRTGLSREQLFQADIAQRIAWAQQYSDIPLVVLAQMNDVTRRDTVKAQAAHMVGIDPASFAYRAPDEKAQQDRLQELKKSSRFNDPTTGQPLTEENAVDYTDAYRAKYHNQPPRGTYLNTAILPEKDAVPPALEAFSCGPAKLEYRNADRQDVGQLPALSPVSCNAVRDALPRR